MTAENLWNGQCLAIWIAIWCIMLPAIYHECGLSVDISVALHLSRTRSPLQSLDGQFDDLAWLKQAICLPDMAVQKD
jgi:hypothetical protein